MVPRYNQYVVGQGLARLTSAYITKPNIRAMLAVYLQPFQDLEDAAFGVLNARILRNAQWYSLPQTNVVFDVLGQMVGVQRGGLSDYNFYTIILLTVAANKSTGRTQDWSRFAQILAPFTSEGIAYRDGIASFEFGLWNLSLPPYAIGAALGPAVGNGIGGELTFTTWPDIGTDIECGSIYDATAGQSGLGSIYDTTAGGVLAASLTME